MERGDSESNVGKLASEFKLIRPTDQNRMGSKSNIINLSHYFRPDRHQVELLEKGLSFVPTVDIYKNQTNKLKTDVAEYHRRLKLAAHFGTERREEAPPFQPRSTWEPNDSTITQGLKQLLQNDNNTINNIPRHLKEKDNLTREQVKALRELANNKQIVIKPADKGSCIVIMDRHQYLFEGERQLNNRDHYSQLPEPIYEETAIKAKEIINRLREKKYISHKQEQYLLGEETPRPRNFYLLPKIHKSPESWTVPYAIPPGRPIVSDCGSETYRTAEYIEYYLNPLSTKHASYIKDTYHFVEKIRNISVAKEALLFSIDIDSLYTNIETPAGLEAIRTVFNKYPDPERPETELLELLELNLTKNDFEFNNKYYLQTRGTAMGKRFAPSYANIYMSLWEQTALEKCRLKPTHYFRFLDDIFGIWEHTQEEFLEFINVLNTHHRAITIKYVTSRDKIDFLDVTAYKGAEFNRSSKLDLKVFFKETDTHALLHKSSFHPPHCYTGIVKSQLLRFHRICTQESDFKMACKTLFNALRKRGYTRTFLRKAQKTFLEVKQRDHGPKLALVTNYSTQSKIANARIKQNYQNRANGLLPEYKIISAYRKNKNLKDYLVRSRLKDTGPTTQKDPQFFEQKQFVKNRTTKVTVGIKQQFRADTTNCVYLITCKKCGLQYVGETKNTIAERFNQHRYNINNARKTALFIVQHFMTHGVNAMSVSGLQYNPNWTEGQRRFIEKQWIKKLNTNYPGGLNWGRPT